MTSSHGSGIGGSDLDKMAEELHSWMLDEIDALVTELVEPYPFGTTPLGSVEQYTAYRQMDEARLTAMIKQIEERYRGFPDARKRTQDALNKYFAAMQKLSEKFGAGAP